ncbi:MAG: DUF5615 family PIN-like protein [Bacteroidota bacterium]
MEFIIDAHLPLRLKKWLNDRGHDALHTDDLPKKEFTSDKEIIDFAEKEGRIVISKDSDFYKYNLIKGVPKRILFITTGNIINKELIRLFELNFENILEYFQKNNNVTELSNSAIIVHS